MLPLFTQLRSLFRPTTPRQDHRPSRPKRNANRWRPTLLLLEDRVCPSAVRTDIFRGIVPPSTLAASDDGSTGQVALGFTANFFGVSSNQVYVNNNGNLTFDQALGT